MRSWFTTRFYWFLAVVAALLACAPGWHVLGYVAGVLAAALALAVLVDLAIGPARSEIAVRRLEAEHFALRVAAELGYEVEQRSEQSLRLGIFETPLRTLRFDDEEVSAVLPPRSRATLRRRVTPVARGAESLGRLFVWFENPIGLLRRRLRVDAARPIRVYPDLAAVERYGALHVRNRLIEAGLRRMRLRGIGTEFESLREYANGDEFRTIDWKATARRGKLMVAQHEVERSQHVMLAIDCGRLMTPRVDEQRKLDYAVTAALSLASIASLASDKVGLVAFASQILVARAPRSTASSLRDLAEAVYDLEPRFEESDYARAFSYMRAHLRKRSLIVLFTDVIDPIAQGMVLAELSGLAKHHVVVCAFMNDAAVVNALAHVPTTADDAYRRDVALGLERERKLAAANLERAGIRVIDVPARALSVATIDRYLQIKQRGAL